jgi:ankyrin repeat protein
MKSEGLIEAVKKGDASKVAALLDEDRALLTAKEANTSAILLALYHGHPEIARLFLERGAQLTFPEACAIGDHQRALDLLENDPSLVRSYSDDGFPAAGLSIFFQHPELARVLIERGADVNAAARNPQRVAPVHAAAAVRDHQTMKLLLERGADPNARQQLGFTAFHAAASRGDIEMATILLQHGADPHLRTEDGKNSVDIAEKYNQPAFADWFRTSIK